MTDPQISSLSVRIPTGGSLEIAAVVHLPRGRSIDDMRTVAILVHGGPGGSKEGPSDLYVRLGKALAEAGIAALSFDFLGVGESDGEYVNQTPASQVDQLRTVRRWAAERCGSVSLVGESFGATSALRNVEGIDALVLLWPCIWLLDVSFAPFVTSERLDQARVNGFLLEGSDRIGLPFLQEILDDDDREAELSTVSAPTLLIHGDFDTEVPYSQSVRAHDLLNVEKKLVIVPGADHCLRRPDEQELTIGETVTWITSHVIGEMGAAANTEVS